MAVHDAVLKYLHTPYRFDPARGDLIDWLFVSARNLAIDLERRAARYRRVEVQRGLQLADLPDEVEPPEAEQAKADWILWYRMELFGACRTDAERRFVAARLAGASREVQSRALGVDKLGSHEARTEMNRTWNLVVKRLRRGTSPRPKRNG